MFNRDAEYIFTCSSLVQSKKNAPKGISNTNEQTLAVIFRIIVVWCLIRTSRTRTQTHTAMLVITVLMSPMEISWTLTGMVWETAVITTLTETVCIMCHNPDSISLSWAHRWLLLYDYYYTLYLGIFTLYFFFCRNPQHAG